MGLEEEEQGSKGGRAGPERAGGTPTGSGIVPGAAIQRNTGCQALPPAIVAAVVAAAAAWPTLGRGGGGTWGPKVQPLILDFEDCHSVAPADQALSPTPPPPSLPFPHHSNC